MSYTADLVMATTDDGITLAGSLRRPTRPASGDSGIDLWILHHGLGGNFYRGGLFDHLSEYLLSSGSAVLRVNNRGSDLIASGQRNGKPVRLGGAYELVSECLHDWRAWTSFGAEQGFRRIGIWAHSLGAVKTIYAAAVDPDPRVTLAVASSPPRFAFDMYTQGPDAEEFRTSYEQAQRLVDAGQGDTLIEMTLPARAVLAASTFVDKYGPAGGYDILKHLPQVTLPLLVTVGGLEATGPQRIAFADHETAVGQLAGTRPNLSFHLVPGADHSYTAREPALWEAVRGWVAGAASAAAAH
jgi:hypothetical protein